MATNYSVKSTFYNGKYYYVMKTKASNIQVVSFRAKYGKDMFIRDTQFPIQCDTEYYGMNASFFNSIPFSSTYGTIYNIAYQDGKAVGPNGQGEENSCGFGVVYWDGTQLMHSDKVQYGSVLGLPVKSGVWAQGGYSLYLGNSGWRKLFLEDQWGSDHLSEEGSTKDPKDARTGILIDKSTKEVYLFITIASVTVEDIRGAMMSEASISEGNNPNGRWQAILTDGGHSAQMFSAECDILFTGIGPARAVPQIIALKNKT